MLKKVIFSIRGRHLCLFHICTSCKFYISNSQENNSFELLENDVCEFKSNVRVVLMGDFNSRTSTSPDFNVTDDDKYNPVPEQYKSDEHE